MDAPIEVLLQHWPGVLFRQTPDLRFQFISERIAEWTGHPAAAWLEQPDLFLQCVHEDDAKLLRQHLVQAENSPDGIRARFRLLHAQTGRITQVTAGAKGGPKFHEGFWQDETPLVLAEQRLAAASWAEILSRLTPGFAHDFNNVIAGVHGLSDTFLSQLEPGHPFHDGLALMKKNTMQGAKLVQRLQQLHHLRPGERAYHDLNALTQDTAELLRRGFSKRYEIVVEVAPSQLPIHTDATELQHAILALALNAIDAMPEHGRLTLRTSAPAQPTGQRVCISVHDSERVLTPAQVQSLLNSGLQHARDISEKHGGSFSVESKPGQGTTFRVWLPQADFTEGR
jgi:signal transduction histidine kinase